MADKDVQDLATKQAAERVDKAEFINAEVLTRLHQNDEQPGITEKPQPKPKTGGKVADKP